MIIVAETAHGVKRLEMGEGGRLFVIGVDEQYSMSFHASEFVIHNGVNEPLFLFKLTNAEMTDHV